MTTSTITVEKADAADLDYVEALLEANGLPHRDVRTKPECFFVASADAERVGVGGLETHGPNGLLRSVAIAETHRGRGYGSALCEALEDYARENGVETLYLLTTTAPDFFRQRGYEAIGREDAPSRIRQTTEFTDLCPDSATCMEKDLR
jgi:amino-acid N-acetyltransferase